MSIARARSPVSPVHLALLVLALAALSPAAPAQPLSSPFVVALGGVYDPTGPSLEPEQFAALPDGPVQVEAGSLPTAYGVFRAAHGSVGLDIQVAQGMGREVYGGTGWSDGFRLVGNAGPATLKLTVRVEGEIVGQSELGFALFVSDQPFSLQTVLDEIEASDGLSNLVLPNATRMIYTGVANNCGMSRPIGECNKAPFINYQGALDLTFSAGVEVQDEQPIYVLSGFSSGVGVLGGRSDFLNSATFGILSSNGMTLESLSGTIYPTMVPEPSALWLFASGMLALSLRARQSIFTNNKAGGIVT